MLKRIVKMGFQPDKIAQFLQNFEKNKAKISTFEGCHFLELYRDYTQRNCFFTYSFWENEKALENYRSSEVFKNIWAKTKPLFNQKPEAWSVETLWSSEKISHK